MFNISTPSLKALKDLESNTIGNDELKLVRAWFEYLNGTREKRPAPYPEPVRAWMRSCYNGPSRTEAVEATIAWILTDGRDMGFEVFAPANQDEWKSYADGPDWTAINMGDPYVATIVRSPNGNYRVRCWGDVPAFCK